MGRTREGLQEVNSARLDSLFFWNDCSPEKTTWTIGPDHWVYLHSNNTLIIKRNPCDLRIDEYVPRGFVQSVYLSGTKVEGIIKSMREVFYLPHDLVKEQIDKISGCLVEEYCD